MIPNMFGGMLPLLKVEGVGRGGGEMAISFHPYPAMKLLVFHKEIIPPYLDWTSMISLKVGCYDDHSAL